MTDEPPRNDSSIASRLANLFAGLLLFAATALVVWWQNTRLTVLYDLSGVLEPATRIAQGELPYRDFPFPYAPLTFITQAELIRLTGAVYWHHIVYACVIAGLASLLTWRIIVALFRDHLPRPRLTAFLLSVPCVVLGVYCIFPHPFYDPDAAFVVLLSVWLILKVERAGFPWVPTVLAGVLVIVPLFVKQNIGLAFGGSVGLWLVSTIAFGLRRKQTVRGDIAIFIGMLIGVGAAALIINAAFGLQIYKYWTWDFATARRTPSLGDMLAVYADWMLVVWVGIFLAGAYLFVANRDGRRSGSVIGILLMAVPFLWPVVYLMIDQDASERAERLVALWPITFVAMLLLSYAFTRRGGGVAYGLPFILAATAHGVFSSQQLWGSTYGIWPLLVIMLGLVIVQLHKPDRAPTGAYTLVLAVLMAAAISTAGGFYIYSNERLDYVSFDDGEMHHSQLPQLEGMSMRGDYLPTFDEMIGWTEQNIPRDDGILCLPGEDLFFYTTGRHPHFPVLLFDVTNNPYPVEDIRQRVVASDIEWLIVKDEVQVEADDMIDSKDKILESLKPDFRSVETLDNYEIFKRRHTGDPPDEDDDGGDDDTDEPEK